MTDPDMSALEFKARLQGIRQIRTTMGLLLDVLDNPGRLAGDATRIGRALSSCQTAIGAELVSLGADLSDAEARRELGEVLMASRSTELISALPDHDAPLHACSLQSLCRQAETVGLPLIALKLRKGLKVDQTCSADHSDSSIPSVSHLFHAAIAGWHDQPGEVRAALLGISEQALILPGLLFALRTGRGPAAADDPLTGLFEEVLRDQIARHDPVLPSEKFFGLKEIRLMAAAGLCRERVRGALDTLRKDSDRAEAEILARSIRSNHGWIDFLGALVRPAEQIAAYARVAGRPAKVALDA